MKSEEQIVETCCPYLTAPPLRLSASLAIKVIKRAELGAMPASMPVSATML